MVKLFGKRKFPLKDKLLRTGLLSRGAKIMVGVSGGADSTALLHLLYGLRHEFALDIVVAHYDHGLRPGSFRDRRFVEKMAGDLGLLFVSETNAQKKPAGASLEDFARRQRFDFFVRKAKGLKVDAVALAHTRDDLAETVLMRILRGAGLDGLRAIIPQRSIDGVVFLRLLLDVTRAEIEDFLGSEGVKFTDDPTNVQDIFLRNRVRHQLIPYIARRFSSAVKEKLAELSLSAGIDYDFIQQELNKVLPVVLVWRSGKVCVVISKWKVLHRSLRLMVLREAMERTGRRPAGLSFHHAFSLERAAISGARGKVSLSRGVQAFISDKLITLS